MVVFENILYLSRFQATISFFIHSIFILSLIVIFRLKKELVWSESEVRRVLPGHPQIVNLGEILLAGRNSAVIEQDPSTILSIPS